MMKSKLFAAAALTALVTTTACTTDPETGQRRLSSTAIGGIGGALGGYVLGDLVGGRNGSQSVKTMGKRVKVKTVGTE